MTPQKTPLEQAENAFRPVLWVVLFFGLFINLLMFVSPLYMMQVYDRVLSSRNEVTLLMLTVISVTLLGIYGLLEYVRSRILARAGNRFDEVLAKPVFHAILKARILGDQPHITQAMRDVGTIREFLTGQALTAFTDAPWAPLFIVAVFLLHPYLGLIALCGAIIIFSIALLNEILTRPVIKDSSMASMIAHQHVESSSRNAEVVRALGMRGTLTNAWETRHNESVSASTKASDRSGALVALQKFIRMGLQVAILGTGAWLAIQRETSPGTMIAASIMMGRALQPVEQSVGAWKSFIAMRQSRQKLKKLFEHIKGEPEVMDLPAPKGQVLVDHIYAGPPRMQKPVLADVSFLLNPGEIMAVVGPSAAGKSVLARCLVGVWAARAGHVRLDGNDLMHWDPEKLGKFVGYLPQDVELFSGTVAENIARLGEVDHKKVLKAAEAAGVHELIQTLPEGYDTQIGEEGQVLSGGQRQRIGLARALYGDPVFVVLDEPNSNLDSAGEEALRATLNRLRGNATVVLISHKPNILTIVDRILVLKEGKVQMHGSRDEILPKLMGQGAAPQKPNSPAGSAPSRMQTPPPAFGGGTTAQNIARIEPKTIAAQAPSNADQQDQKQDKG